MKSKALGGVVLFLLISVIAGVMIMRGDEQRLVSDSTNDTARPQVEASTPSRRVEETRMADQRDARIISLSGEGEGPPWRVVLLESHVMGDAPPKVWLGMVESDDPGAAEHPAPTSWLPMTCSEGDDGWEFELPDWADGGLLHIVGMASDESHYFVRRLIPSDLSANVAVRPRPVTTLALTVRSGLEAPLEMLLAVPDRERLPVNDLVEALRRLAFPDIADALDGEAPMIVEPGDTMELALLDPFEEIISVFRSPRSGRTVAFQTPLERGLHQSLTIDVDVDDGAPVDLLITLVCRQSGEPIPGMIVEHERFPQRFRGVSDGAGQVLIESFDTLLTPLFHIVRPESEDASRRPRHPRRTSIEIPLGPEDVEEGSVEHRAELHALYWLEINVSGLPPAAPPFPVLAIQSHDHEIDQWTTTTAVESHAHDDVRAVAVMEPGLYRGVVLLSCGQFAYTEPEPLDDAVPEATAVWDAPTSPPVREQKIALLLNGQPAITASRLAIVPGWRIDGECPPIPVGRDGVADLGVISEGPLVLRVTTFERVYRVALEVTADTPNPLTIELTRFPTIGGDE